MKRVQRSVSIAVLSWAALAAACSERPAPAPAPSPESNPPPPAQPAAEPAAEPSQPAAAPEQPAQGKSGEPRAEPTAEPADPSAPSAPGTAAPCGEKGQTPCPLQGWMERNLQKPLDDDDLARVAKGLARVPKLVPDPSWNEGDQGWSKIAETGAAAAKAKDADGVEQACKTCHKTWRKKYKQSHRLDPVSD